MTLTQLLQDCYRRLNFATTSTAPEVAIRFTAFLNEAQQELASHPGLAPLLRGQTSLITVSALSTYGLPPYVTRVRAITTGTNDRKLYARTESWWRTVAPDPTAINGSPTDYAAIGSRAVKTQPVGATGLWVGSSLAGDTSQTIALEGVRSGGYLFTPTPQLLTGTTLVQIGTQADYTEITDLYLSAVCGGDVTVYDAATSGTVLAVIPKGLLRVRHEVVALYPTPSSAIGYTVFDERDATDLVSATDEPGWLPVRYHRLLAVGARKREYEKTHDERAGVTQEEWDRGVKQLLAYVNNAPDETMVPGRFGRGLSDLGGYYPAGTIWD